MESVVKQKFMLKIIKLYKLMEDDGPANNQKLCVKGEFGFDYIP